MSWPVFLGLAACLWAAVPIGSMFSSLAGRAPGVETGLDLLLVWFGVVVGLAWAGLVTYLERPSINPRAL